ncbi:protein transporter SEC22 [Blastocladiella britannica]|nr:protein transporter SEC22 [Blastocladiella britannica]
MVRSALIHRLRDNLPLASSLDDAQTEAELREAKSNAKQVLTKLSLQSEPRCSIENGPFTFHYMIENEITYLAICDRAYQRAMAFEFLSELAREFYAQHGADVPTAPRAYAFVKFDTFIQKLKRQFADTRNASHLQRLNDDLQDVTRIMTKNMEDLLYRGDTLDRMGSMSEALRDSSLKYRKDARRLRLEAMYRAYGPPAVVLFVVLFVLWWRFS